QTPGNGISILLAVGTPSTGSGNVYFQWELSPGSGNPLCILFPTCTIFLHGSDSEQMTHEFMHVYLVFASVYVWIGTGKTLLRPALPHDSSPRVTSLDVDEGSMQQRIHELTELCTSLQRKQSQMAAKIKDQDLEISELKARVKFLEDKESRSVEPTQEDASIICGIMEIWEELRADKSTELGSNDTEEMVNVLSSMEAANILTSEGAAASVSPGDVLPTTGVPTVSPMRSLIIRAKDKGKEKVVESEVPKKRKLQEQIDAQGLDRSNEVIAKHLREYEQAAADLSVRENLELINFEDQLWTYHQAFMHDPLDWKIYDTCGVHHVSTKDQEIYMLVVKDYPLRKGIATIIMVNIIPPDHVDEVPVVEPNQHDDVLVVLEYVLNELELTYPYEEVDPLNPLSPAFESEHDDEIKVKNPIEYEDGTVPASVHERGQDVAPAICECTFAGFIKCNPTVFRGVKGAVELRRWFEKTESVFRFSECEEGKKVKFIAATLEGSASTWGFVFKERPNEAIDVPVEDETSLSSEP
nr:hypothetical protein [Tanacetum cinerariifolium]